MVCPSDSNSRSPRAPNFFLTAGKDTPGVLCSTVSVGLGGCSVLGVKKDQFSVFVLYCSSSTLTECLLAIRVLLFDGKFLIALVIIGYDIVLLLSGFFLTNL